jgi:hypothetical protein
LMKVKSLEESMKLLKILKKKVMIKSLSWIKINKLKIAHFLSMIF